VVEASRRHGRWPYRRTRPLEAVLTRIPSGSVSEPNETELEEAGARRLLAAVDELNEREGHERAEDWKSVMSAGLFEIRLGGRPAAAAEQSARRVEPPFRQADEPGLHRYCSGCSQETEHVLCRGGDGAGIPAIRWPATDPASGTTMCVDCGQWRVAASRPHAPAWSFWPRLPAEPGGVLSVSRRDDEAPRESAAENEGMPPLRDPPTPGRRQRARRMKKAIATY
jgi:hypothetical protein